jgi:hypothetical protein
MQVPGQRSLNDKELACVRMLETWEALADARKYASEFTMTEDAMDACVRFGIAQPLSMTKDRATNRFTVKFDLIETHRYIAFLCQQSDVTENLDGTVTTYDGITVPIRFNQQPKQLTKKESK